MRRVLVLIAVTLALFPLYGQFKAKMVFNSMGKERVFDVYSAEAGYRYEFNEDGQEGIIITRSGSNEVIILMPQQRMAMKSPVGSPMSMGNDPLMAFEHYRKEGSLKDEGKEVVNGVQCIRSTLWNRENPNQKMFTVWLSEDYHFPVKMINHIDGSENSGMELRDVEPWTPEADSFEIPSGYQVMDMPGMPAQ